MASGGRKGAAAQPDEISRTRVRISSGHPRYPPLITSEELAAALKQLGCEPLHIEDRGSFFLVTIGEAAVARFEGQTVAVRNHKSTIDPYTLRNESDRRMEAPSVHVSELRTIDIRPQSDTPQPFAPARGAEIAMRLVVKNSSDFPKKLVHIDISNPTHFRTDFANAREWQKIEITKKRSVSVPITFRQTTGLPGVYHTLIFFDVETNVSGLRQETRIRVPVHVSVGDRQLAAALAPKGEYVKREEAPQLPPNIIAAFPPGRATKEHIHTPHDTKYTVPLLQYETPEAIQKQINAGGSPPEFPVWNTKENWRDRMHQLLWWEEAFGRKQVTKYDLWDVQIARVAHGAARTEEPAAEIEVPGLEEKRPSLLKGDRVYVWQLRRGDDAAYEGIVWEVKKSSVVVLFGLSFYMEDPISRWHVRFTYDRLAMRVKHRAVDSVNLEIVYPEAIANSRALQTNVAFVDVHIADNAKQSLALRSMLARRNQDQATGRSIPFLLLGPFGTGKTRTLVEYARQVLRDPKARLLFCSFSNSAADRFCEALAGESQPSRLPSAEMFRLNAFRRDRGSVLPAVWPYCAYLEEQGVFDLPPMSRLEQFRIIVCTATNAGSLHGLGCKPGHFTHIIVDEAARLEEAECLVPLCLATTATQIVLAGDPKQLGPKVQSKSTRTHGLERSLPERLSQYHLYADGDDRVSVHLLQNYRSHAEIVALLDTVFYDNIGLHSCAPQAITTSLSQWPKHNTDASFPFLFISSSGSIAQREADSPSFFNITEAEICGQVLSELLNSKVGRLVQSDVGVFPATRKQTEKIRKTMRIKGLHGVDVVSVEEAHGKEFKVVVMSCVATARGVRSFEQDRLHDIGYCANAKRLNTAISRAACLVIIIGDPHRLAHDPQWQRIIEACKRRRSYIDAGSSDAFIVGDAADLASKAEEAKQRDEAAREAEAAKAQAARKEAAERERKDREAAAAAAAAQQVSRPAAPSGSKATAAAPVAPADSSADDAEEAEEEAEAEAEEEEAEEDEVVPANAPRPALAAVGTPARSSVAAAAAATLSPTAAPFRPSNPPGSHSVRSTFAPIPFGGPWLPSPVVVATPPAAVGKVPMLTAAVERSPQQATQSNPAKQQAPPPPGFAPHLVQHPSGYPMFLPPYFPVLSPQQLQTMYHGQPLPMNNGGGMAPGAPADDGFSSAYRPTGARWNNEDLVLTRADSTFAPTFRVLRLTDGEDALEIVFYTAFFVLGEVRSEGRTVTFSMHQPKQGSEVLFTHIPALTNNSKPAVCHVSITVPRGVRVPLDVVDSEDGERRSIKLTFIADATPVSVQVLSGGKRRAKK